MPTSGRDARAGRLREAESERARRKPALPKYVQRVRKYLYFRWSDGARTPLPADPASPAFHARYAELLAQRSLKRTAAPDGSVAALVQAYLASPQYAGLAQHTRWHYRRLLDELRPIAGFPVTEIRRRHVRALRDGLADRPRTADLFLQAVRRVFGLAVDDEAIDVNPAAGIAALGGGGSHAAWSEAQCAAFEAAAAEGRVPGWALTAYLLGRYTAQRRGDVLRLTWAAYDGRTIRLRQGKTGAELAILVHPRLKAHLDGLARTALYMVTSPTGRPWDPRNFSRELREALDGIGLAGVSFHGLRHLSASALAEAGASEREIMAVTGHKSAESVQRYTRAARQARMAARAIGKLVE